MGKKRYKNIILIGFMGCGKTTTGLRLSWKLKLPVEDTDKLIEKKAGCSISEIFARDGEAAFRKMETELLEQISESRYSRILSVGGGTPVLPENRELLKKCGMVIYLRVKPETVYDAFLRPVAVFMSDSLFSKRAGRGAPGPLSVRISGSRCPF